MLNHLPPAVIAGAIFAIVVLLVVVISQFASSNKKQDQFKSRLSNINSGVTTPEPMSPSFVPGGQQQNAVQQGQDRPDILPTITDYLSSNDIGKKLRLSLHQAGLRLRPAEFVALTVSGTIGMALVGLFLNGHLIMVIVMGIIGMIVPISILSFKQSQRTVKFDKQLPEALTLISSSLRTGYSFLHSCEMVINEMPMPISEEFAWVQGEVRLGVPMEQALQRMVQRVKSYDFDLVVTAVSIQLQVGGNLAEILDTISATIRERVRIQGEINALTAEGKLSGIIVFCLPIVLAIWLNLSQKDYFKPMIEDPGGLMAIIVVSILMVTGGFIIKKMVEIDI